VVAGADVAGPFDSVGVVPGAADDAGVGAVPPAGLRLRGLAMSAMTAA
jgi:hypothetical protein